MQEKFEIDNKTQSFIERVWESGLWSTRYIVVLAVFFSVIAAISLFILGSYEIYHAIVHLNPLTNEYKDIDIFKSGEKI